MLHSVYNQPDAAAVGAQFDRLLYYVIMKLLAVAEHFDGAGPARGHPGVHGRPPGRVEPDLANNSTQRLNHQIPGHIDAAGSFPYRPAIMRLVGAVLAEQTDEWPEDHSSVTSS